MGIEYVDIATAQAARGVRMAVLGSLPSPWSEAAKALFHVKGIPVLAVRFRRGDDELKAWTGSHNVPVVFSDDDPPRTGWAEIVALAERLYGGRTPLVPGDPQARVRFHGLINELAGEDGFQWCARLVMIHESIRTGGARSFPLRVAQFLARKYGYAPERVAAARARVIETMQLLEAERARSAAAGHAYLIGERLTALDLYLATFLNTVVGLSETDCPAMLPALRPAFVHLAEDLGREVPPGLAAHRALVYARHLTWPIAI
jgi:glutathione S-transferase